MAAAHPARTIRRRAGSTYGAPSPTRRCAEIAVVGGARIYADPGTDVQCVVVRNGGFSAAGAMCSISGYLVQAR